MLPTDHDVPLDLRATAKAFSDGWHKVSWTKLNTFRKCQVSWFFENYAVPLERQVYSDDGAAAIPGTLIQRIWEGVINNRVFLHSQSDAHLAKWMAEQSLALFHTIVFPMEAQFTGSRADQRKFFRTAPGKQHLQWATQTHGLHEMFYTGIQPKYTDIDKFAESRKLASLDSFIAKLERQYLKMLEKFKELDVDLSQMLSEEFIRTKWGEIELAGGVDFLYNRVPPKLLNAHGRPTGQLAPAFDKIHQLQNGYLLMDGKAQIGPSVSAGQLYLYALILYMNYRVLPSMVGFIDWSKSDFVWYPINLGHLEQTKRTIQTMQMTAFKVRDSLNRMVEQSPPDQNTLSVYDLPHLTFTSGRIECMFCGMSKVCSHAIAGGYNRPRDRTAIYTREVAEGIDHAAIAHGGMNEVSFEP